MNVWTVVPLSRPGQLPWVIENWARQTTKSSLAIVETGEALGVCHQAGISPDLLLSAAGRPGEVRNAALEALVGAYVSFQDDDDWYGPDYLAEHVELAARGRIVGKRVHWVDFLGDELLLFRPQAANTRGGWVLAGTMSGYAEDFPRFSAVETGEERPLCAAAHEVLSSSVQNFVYLRRPDQMSHTLPVSKAALEDLQGRAAARYPSGEWWRATSSGSAGIPDTRAARAL